MTLTILLSISATLFVAVTLFAHSQGLFDGSAMGIGWLFALGLYLLFWVGGTALATLVALVAHRLA
jgi:hypothetical protein